MDPADFLNVADQFQASPFEAERRTSVGRSYYALYNVLFAFLSSRGVLFENGGRDHWWLVYYLTNCPHRQAARIGAALRDLRILRIDADYHMNVAINPPQSQLAYRQAGNAVNRFKGLQAADLQNIVQLINALPQHPAT